MTTRPQNNYLVETIEPINVLLVGFDKRLYQSIEARLIQWACHVYSKFPANSSPSFTYIIQKDRPRDIAKNLSLAASNKAKFIYLNSKKNLIVKKLIEKEILKRKLDIHYTVYQYTDSLDGLLSLVFGKEADLEAIQKIRQLSERKAKVDRFSLKLTAPIFLIFALVIIPLAFMVSTYLSFNFASENFKSALTHYKSGNLIEAKKEMSAANKLFAITNKQFSLVLPVVGLISKQEKKPLADLLDTALYMSKIGSDAIFVTQLTQSISQSIISSRTSVQLSEIENLQAEIKQLDENLAVLISQLTIMRQSSTRIYRLFNLRQQLETGYQMVERFGNLLAFSSQLTKLLPETLGYSSPKTYLLLFQNNSELRPAGGFIGSFGWMTFNKGRLIEFKIEDVYTADGQLKGHVDPPVPLSKYLKSEHWYLRDSNFDPDFAVSAKQAEWFLKKEMNLSFDGVAAFDLDSVAEVLKGMGGVYLTDYQTEVTSENLFLKAQTFSESSFFPGSTQKRDFLGNLGRAIFVKLTSQAMPWENLLTGLKKSLDEKHLQIYFHNPDMQAVMEEANWAGRIAGSSCLQTNCLSDYLLLNEANLGVNKANFWIERKLTLSITRQDNMLIHELAADFTNLAEQTFPTGDYFVYIRIILPNNISDIEVLDSGKKIPEGDLLIENYQDKKSIGFPLRVHAREDKKLELKYSLPVSSNAVDLELFVQKQAGVKSYPMAITYKSNQTVNKNLQLDKDQLATFAL